MLREVNIKCISNFSQASLGAKYYLLYWIYHLKCWILKKMLHIDSVEAGIFFLLPILDMCAWWKKITQKLTFRQIQYNFFYINSLLENYKRRSVYWIGLMHLLLLAPPIKKIWSITQFISTWNTVCPRWKRWISFFNYGEAKYI